MADIHLTANRLTIPEFYEQPRALARLLETALNQVLAAQMADHLSADRYERNEDREGYRNGYRDRQLATRIGPLTLRVPQTATAAFQTDIF